MPRRFPLAAVSALALIAATALPADAQAESFRWAGQTDPSTMDPHARNIAPVLSFLNNIYEGLVRRGPDMSIEPSLATSWEPLEGEDGWRFHLREGVSYHDGAAFTADDVLFSYERATAEQSDVSSWFAPVTAVRVVDAHTIDFLTTGPNPLFPSSIANFLIMDRDWAEANDATTPASETENAATRQANGTGPYRLVERAPDVSTRLAAFEGWWDDDRGNVTEAEFVPITSAATAVAALISGEIDFYEPIPLQDAPRIEASPDLTLHSGVESRIIFFGFEMEADQLRFSSAQGNPFQDVRVREAVYRAINNDAIIQTIMRGNAEPAALLINSAASGYNAELDERLAYDPERARELLAEAGYPDGFDFLLRCSNDRYINDEAVCTAVVGMLEQVGLEPELVAEPVSQYFANLREEQFDMFLLGWSPGTFDAEHPLRFLVHTPNDELRMGSWNFGGYSNARIDELMQPILTTIDPTERQAMIDETHRIVLEDIPYVPLYVQPLVWASQADVEVVQRADNFFLLRWVEVGE